MFPVRMVAEEVFDGNKRAEKLIEKAKSPTDDPPLSEIELDDVKAGLREFESGKSRVYDGVEEFLANLHAEREQFQRKRREEGQ